MDMLAGYKLRLQVSDVVEGCCVDVVGARNVLKGFRLADCPAASVCVISVADLIC